MPKLYLIGNAHLDPVRLWRWQEGFSEVLNTFRSVLDHMKDFPDFKFTSVCAVYYQWEEQTDPDMFKEMQQRVKEGRWNSVDAFGHNGNLPKILKARGMDNYVFLRPQPSGKENDLLIAISTSATRKM